MYFDLKTYVTAYRKAKVDAWNLHSINAGEFIAFEKHFMENILAFRDDVVSGNLANNLTDEWLGGWVYRIKQIDMKGPADKREVLFSAKGTAKSATFRIMATPSVRFHLLGALWLETAGVKYNSVLGPCVYGNKLRPDHDPCSAGSFMYYPPQLRAWKQGALEATKLVLAESKSKKAIVVTADATSFYHTLKPDFLLNGVYLATHGIKLTENERRLTDLLVKAIRQWAKPTPLHTGLPVGLPASAHIANLALADFDRLVLKRLKPAYYGRYVDDLLFVLEGKTHLKTGKHVWEHFTGISDWLRVTDNADGPRMDFVPAYAADLTASQVSFGGKKCKTIFLEKTNGLEVLKRLQAQIKEATSEFRLLPRHIGDARSVEERLYRIVSADGEAADAFRKIDAATFRKVDCTAFIQEMEFLKRTLPLRAWKKQWSSFCRFVREEILTLSRYADYESTFLRLWSLAARCGDFAALKGLLSQWQRLARKIESIGQFHVAGLNEEEEHNKEENSSENSQDKPPVSERWRWPLCAKLADTVIRCHPAGAGGVDGPFRKFSVAFKEITGVDMLGDARATELARESLAHDLSEFRYLEELYRPELLQFNHPEGGVASTTLLQKGIPQDGESAKMFVGNVLHGIKVLCGVLLPGVPLRPVLPYGLLFPTRPFSARDLVCINGLECCRANWDLLVLAFRGYDPHLLRAVETDGVEVLHVAHGGLRNPKIALGSLVTQEKDVGLALGWPGNSCKKRMDRLASIIRLVNSVLERETDLDYLVFHELALPVEWFVPIAARCAQSGVSVISGIDYMVSDAQERHCVNPVWMSLVNTVKDFRQQVCICEGKQKLADSEALEIHKKGYANNPSIRPHAVIHHGGFWFSVLVCSEITDIAKRARLRGYVDALFLLAWNKDLDTFASLVEATTLDLHAYVIQCNNNLYGDSRIRAPAKKDYERDVVRIRGGQPAYYVSATIEIEKLRQFQIDYLGRRRTPGKTDAFKPLPDGYTSRGDRPSDPFASRGGNKK